MIFGLVLWAASSFLDTPSTAKHNSPTANIASSQSVNSSNSSSSSFAKSSSNSSSWHHAQISEPKPPAQPQPKQPQTQPSDTNNQQTGPDETWPTNKVNCVMVTKNPKYIQAYKNAINAWNQTGCFTFNLTNDPKAPIQLKDTDLSATSRQNGNWRSQELGITYTSYLQKPHGMVKADINLDNSPALNNRPVDYVTLVAEHELGHAIGLHHQPENARSIMIPYNAKYPIQTMDVQNVRNLYK